MVARAHRLQGLKLHLPNHRWLRSRPGPHDLRRWARHPTLRGFLVLTLTFGLCAFLILEARRATQAGARRVVVTAALLG